MPDLNEYVSATIAMPGCHIIQVEGLNGDDTRPRYHVGEELCLCDALNAITALEARHCTFETLYARSRATGLRDQNAAVWERGLKFLHAKEQCPGIHRDYDVYRVHERRPFEGMADVRLLPIFGLRLRITSQPSNASSAEFLSLNYYLDDCAWLKLGFFPIQPEKYPLYSRVDRALAASLEIGKMRPSLREWIRELEESLRAAAGPDISPQFLTFVDALTRSVRDASELDRRISNQRTSLWDAPVLDENGVSPLEEHLNDWSKLSHVVPHLPLDVQTRLLRALLPLEQLDAANRYLRSIPSNL